MTRNTKWALVVPTMFLPVASALACVGSTPTFSPLKDAGATDGNFAWLDGSSDEGADIGRDVGPVNLALHRSISASSYTLDLVATNANDGDPYTYWESANGAFPQSLTVDLGIAQKVDEIVLKLPPLNGWPARTQTLSVSGSADGSSFMTLAGSSSFNFDPANGNSATIHFTTASERFIQVNFTGNTDRPAGQCSELEVYGP